MKHIQAGVCRPIREAFYTQINDFLYASGITDGEKSFHHIWLSPYAMLHVLLTRAINDRPEPTSNIRSRLQTWERKEYRSLWWSAARSATVSGIQGTSSQAILRKNEARFFHWTNRKWFLHNPHFPLNPGRMAFLFSLVPHHYIEWGSGLFFNYHSFS